MGLLRPGNEYVSYCFDEVCHAWGTFVESELQKAEKGGKTDQARIQQRMRRLAELLRHQGSATQKDGEEPAAVPKGMYRDPATMMSMK